MRKIVGTSIDHFSIGTVNRKRAMEVMRGLGFITGGKPEDRLTHFMFDNSYMEFSRGDQDVVFAGLGKIMSRREKPTLCSILLSAPNADAARQEFVDAGYEVSPCWIASRWGKHGKQQGYVSFKAFMLRGVKPFETDRLYGFSVHLTPELIFQKERFLHVNDVAAVESITFCAKDAQAVESAEAEMKKVDTLAKKHAIPGYYIRYATLLDPEEYKAEFGAEAPACEQLMGAAVVFTGGDKEYIKAYADELGLASFYRDGKLYVDVREDIGLFFVFK